MGKIKDTEKRKGKPRLQPVEPHRADGKLVHSNSLIKEIEKERYKLSAYFENLPAMAYNVSFDGEIIDCNQRVVKTLGYDNKFDLIGKPLLKTIYAPSCRDKAKRLFKQWKKEGVVHNEEMQVITKDGHVIDVLLNVDTIFDHNGDPVHSLSTQLDITERKRAEEALRASEAKYQDLYDNAPDMFVSVSATTGKILECNTTTSRALGYRKEEIVGKHIRRMYHPDSEERRKKVFEKFLEKGQVRDAELQLKRKDGSKLDVSLNISAIRDDHGRILYSRSIWRDITERKRAEEALKESEIKYKEVTEHLGKLVYRADANNYQTTYVNHAIEKLYGYTAKEWIADSTLWENVIYPEDRKRTITVFEESRKKVKPGVATYRIIRKDKIVRWVEDHFNWQKDQQGNVIAIFGTVLDITERKRAEDALRKSSERLVKAQHIARMGFQDWDLRTNRIFWSDEVYHLFGIEPVGSPQTLESTVALVHPDDREMAEQSLENAVAGIAEHNLDHRMVRSDGQVIWVHAQAELERDESGAPKILLGTIVDITERKQAEEALRESEEKYRSLVDTLTDAVMVFDAETRLFLQVNSATENLYGYTREEFLALKQSDITAEPEESEKSIAEALEEKLDRIPLRYHKKKDGTTFPVEISASTFELGGRKLLCGIVRDITKRKRTEETLRVSEEKFREFCELLPETVAETDDEGNLVFTNRNAFRMFGFSREDLDGGLNCSEMLVPEDRDRARDNIRRVFQGETISPNEYTALKKDGSTFPILIYSSAIIKEGERCGLRAIIVDITERKHAEEAIRKSEQRYRERFEKSRDGFVVLDAKGNFMDANLAYCEMLGFTLDELKSKADFSEITPPLWRDWEREEIWEKQLLQDGYSGIYEKEYIRKDGTVFPVELQSYAVFDEQGKPLYLWSIARDITERKRTEEANYQYQAKLKSMNLQLSMVQELERRALSKRLHDSVSQNLAMAKLTLQQCAQSITDAGVAKKLAGVSTQIRSIIEDSYSVMLELSNPLLYELGLVEAIRSLLESRFLADLGFKCDLVAPKERLGLGRNMRVVLYRAVRELLINVGKHAKAEKAEVLIQKQNDCLVITVKDDGVGFEFSDLTLPSTAGGFGLFNVKESLEGIGAEMNIESKLGKGTAVKINAPLECQVPIQFGGEEL